MFRPAALMTSVALLTLAGSALAQNEMRLIDEERALYRATFEGGTLTEFVEMLQEGLDGRVMFVMPERGDEVEMPKFDIAHVDAAQVIGLTRIIAGVPAIEVQDELALPFSQYEGVPVYVFPTEGALPTRRGVTDRIGELRFPGGTVREYVEALKRAGAEGRVVLTGDDRDIPMQPVTLRNVSLFSAVELLDGIESNDDRRMSRVVTSSNEGLFRVHVDTIERTGTRARGTRVWSLRSITARGLDDDTLLAAIETGAETLDEDARPTLRYHEPTALLIANGTDDAIGLIDAIIDGLTSTAIAESNTISATERMEQYAGLLGRYIERLESELATNLESEEVSLAQADAIRERLEGLSLEEIGIGNPLRAELSRLERTSDDARERAQELRFEIDGERMRLTQLRQLMKQVDEGFARTPTEEMLRQEFGVPSRSER